MLLRSLFSVRRLSPLFRGHQRRGIGPSTTAAAQPRDWTALVTLAVCVLTLAFQCYSRISDNAIARDKELMNLRREAMLQLLEVVDHNLANTSIGGRPPTNPHQWDMGLAHSAMSKVIIYAKNPNRVLGAFKRATGLATLSNGNISASESFDVGHELSCLRQAIADELEVPPGSRFIDPDMQWLATLSGATYRGAEITSDPTMPFRESIEATRRARPAVEGSAPPRQGRPAVRPCT